ncbi:alpha/beta fold hydrolase [Gordonia soli]|uniref:Putative hydrolase n=1 Tax=Gordonia soli NBRC 108243 TaxID=1223545 RepID=M0QH72_9ACTN|nr:alpha/beta hydrolase [Gordonia soli]GAC67784.1 putative hydrolase [Gordonia soli NBRC 108243]
MQIHRRPTDGGDIDIAVRTSGTPTPDGLPSILLVHGMGGDHTTWRRTAARLRAQDRALIAVDLRGHGRSARTPTYFLDEFAADLGHVVDEIADGPVDVVAHSLGAHAALRMAAARPTRVRRMVLEEIPPMPRDAADLADPVTIGAGVLERLRGVAALIGDPAPFLRFDRAMAELVTRQFDVADPAWWMSLSGVAAPTLIISGGRRSFLPVEVLQILAEELPDGRLEVVDAGHSVHRDRSTRFAELVSGFLGQATR